MTRLALAAFVLVPAVVLFAAPVPKDRKLSESEVRARLEGPWDWEVVSEESRNVPPLGVTVHGRTWHFMGERAVETINMGQVEQEGHGFRLDVTTTPMRLDLTHGDYVTPGLFRFDGPNLVWVRGDFVTQDELKREDPKAPLRPDCLSPTLTKRWTKQTLKPRAAPPQ